MIADSVFRFGADEKINIANGLAMSPQAAGDTATNHAVVRAQRLNDRLSGEISLIVAMARTELPHQHNAFENLLLGLLSETFERCDLSRLARGFEFLDGVDSEFVVEQLCAFRAEPGDLEHVEQDLAASTP